jgi:hypothetical protein
MTNFDVDAEFDRQVQRFLDKGYPAAAGMEQHAFLDLVTPLHKAVLEYEGEFAPPTKARVPFLLVIAKERVTASRSMPLTELRGGSGFVTDTFDDVDRFMPIESVVIPGGDAYVLFDLDRGADYLNVRPNDALISMIGAGRTPLTVEEGIAFITQFPDSLEKNHCFSLLASRGSDKRVPALWISKAMPKLGWCWAGNPHTWLGAAHAAGRAGLLGASSRRAE